VIDVHHQGRGRGGVDAIDDSNRPVDLSPRLARRTDLGLRQPDVFPHRGPRRGQLGDDIAPLVVDEVPRGCGWASEAQPKSAVGRARVGDDAGDQLLEAVVHIRAAEPS